MPIYHMKNVISTISSQSESYYQNLQICALTLLPEKLSACQCRITAIGNYILLPLLL